MLRKMGLKVDVVLDSERSNGEEDIEGALLLFKEKIFQVVKGLMSLLLSMDFICNVDFFFITCKVELKKVMQIVDIIKLIYM